MKKLRLAVLTALLLTGLCHAECAPLKVKLSLYERITIVGLLPIENNFATLKIIASLKAELAPNDEECRKAGLSVAPRGGIQARNWNAVEIKEYTIGETVKGLIVNALKNLDKRKKLSKNHMSLYEKFIIGEPILLEDPQIKFKSKWNWFKKEK